MSDFVTIGGTLTDERTVRLDSPVAGPRGRVRLQLERINLPTNRPTLREFLEELRKRQSAQGHVPRSAEEIRASIQDDRDKWDD
jgi:hypothetical protein